VVDTKKDVGFVATSSLAGGRLASDLKDTPAAYSVLTREFIDALGLTELSEASRWAPNTTLVNDDGRQEMFGNTTAFSFRGVSGSTQRNFFPFAVNYDSYNLDRFDYARGPNSILFGQGSFGGSANVVTKRAQTAKQLTELRLSYGSWNNERVAFDVNRPFAGGRAAVRVNVVHVDRDGWRDREMERKRAGHFAATYQPFKNTQVSVEAERGQITLSIGPALRRKMETEKVYCAVADVVPSADKRTRSQSILARMSMGKVLFPRFAPWWSDAENQMLSFPGGPHDDFVDALSLIGLKLGLVTRRQVATPAKSGGQELSLRWVKGAAASAMREKVGTIYRQNWG
jgi:predicted phage terminase large subunit-like protein